MKSDEAGKELELSEAGVADFLANVDLTKHPNAKKVILQAMRDQLTMGSAEAIERLGLLKARDDVYEYARRVFEYEAAPHHQEIVKAVSGDDERVLVIAPPGFSKSSWGTVIYGSHEFSKRFEESILLVSCTADQAVTFTGAIRDLVSESDAYTAIFPEVRMDESKGWSKDKLYLANRTDKGNISPNLFGVGVSGPILGRRANLILVDDPITQDQAQSPEAMKKIKSWFKGTLMTRLVPSNGRIRVILTRWGENDLASMLMDDLNFKVIAMPALGHPEKGAYVDIILPRFFYPDEDGNETDEIDEDTELENLLKLQAGYEAEGYECEITRSLTNPKRLCVRKYFGFKGPNKQSCWPNYFSVAKLRQIKRGHTSAEWRLFFQADPVGASGSIFKSKDFRYWGPDVTTTYEGNDGPLNEIPEDARWYQFTDVAIGQNRENDFFVIITVAVDSMGRIYIVDVVRTKVEAPDQPKLIEALYTKYPKTEWVLIEAVSMGLSLFQTLLRTKMIPLKKCVPSKDKKARSRSSAVQYNNGKIYHLQGAPWLDAFEYELTSFDSGKHDDQVDALSNGLEELALNARTPKTLKIGFHSRH